MSQVQAILDAALQAEYAALPKIELPGDDSRLLECAKKVLPHVKNKGLYRRDMVVMVAYEPKKRLEPIDAATFRTWVEDYVVFYKTRFNPKTEETWDVYRTIPQEGAQGILSSRAFWPELHEIEKTLSVRLPANFTAEDGSLQVQLTQVGYSEEHKTYTYSNQ